MIYVPTVIALAVSLWPGPGTVGMWAVAIVPIAVAGVCDHYENKTWLRLEATFPSQRDSDCRVASACTTSKWIFVIVSLAICVVLLLSGAQPF